MGKLFNPHSLAEVRGLKIFAASPIAMNISE